MTDINKALANLALIGKLVRESGSNSEIESLIASGNERLVDARNHQLALSSRFDLAYNAAHAFSLAALRWHGYRSNSRYLVFQSLPHTLGQPPEVWRVLAKVHEVRNVAEYEGHLEADATLVQGLIKATEAIRLSVTALPPLQEPDGE